MTGNGSLKGARLYGADLEDADLAGAEMSVRTVLPDGLSWAPTIDLGRFTDPEHGEFWEPPWRKGR